MSKAAEPSPSPGRRHHRRIVPRARTRQVPRPPPHRRCRCTRPTNVERTADAVGVREIFLDGYSWERQPATTNRHVIIEADDVPRRTGRRVRPRGCGIARPDRRRQQIDLLTWHDEHQLRWAGDAAARRSTSFSRSNNRFRPLRTRTSALSTRPRLAADNRLRHRPSRASSSDTTRQTRLADSEFSGDLLQQHIGLTVANDTNHVLVELLGSS